MCSPGVVGRLSVTSFGTRQSRRGIDGIFCGRLRLWQEKDVDLWKKFGIFWGNAFIKAEIPFVEKKKNPTLKNIINNVLPLR
jgi:hypothetical protein